MILRVDARNGGDTFSKAHHLLLSIVGAYSSRNICLLKRKGGLVKQKHPNSFQLGLLHGRLYHHFKSVEVMFKTPYEGTYSKPCERTMALFQSDHFWWERVEVSLENPMN